MVVPERSKFTKVFLSSPPLEEYRQSRGGGQIIRFYVNHPVASRHPSIEGNFYNALRAKIPRLGRDGLLERQRQQDGEG